MEKSLAFQPISSELHNKVISILVEVLQIDIDHDVEDFSRYDTPDWDSVNHLRLALEFEEAFNITLPDDKWAYIESLRDLEAVLADCLSNPSRTDGESWHIVEGGILK